jgi:hypothetical protein
MKKLNLATTAAVATVMSATGAYADLSLGGAIATVFTSGDGTSGYSQYGTSYTINIDYTTTLDNGMGMATNVDINPGYTSSSGAHDSSPVNYLMTMSSDLGSVFFGTDFASAVDNNDYAQGAARYQTNGQIISSGWNDGDAASGNGIGVSSSVGPASVQVTYGSGSDRAMSIAATMTVAGASIKAGNTDFDTAASDQGFVSVGYSVGGFNLGWNHFDMGDDTYTQMGASTTVAGLGVGVSVADLSDNDDNDHDAMGIHVSGDLGGAFWVVDYISEDNGAGTETDNWYLTVGTGF